MQADKVHFYAYGVLSDHKIQKYIRLNLSDSNFCVVNI